MLWWVSTFPQTRGRLPCCSWCLAISGAIASFTTHVSNRPIVQVQLHALGSRLCILRLRLAAGRIPGGGGAGAGPHAEGKLVNIDILSY